MPTTLYASVIVTALLAVAGCTSTTTQSTGGVAGLLANSLPGGAVSQNGQLVTAAQNAANTPNVQTITTAVNSANGSNTTPSNVTTALTPQNIMAAVAAAQTAAAARQQNYQANPNAIGPGPFFSGPNALGPGNVLQGPPAFKVIQTSP